MISIGHFGQEEIGIGRIYLLDNRKREECIDNFRPFCQYDAYPFFFLGFLIHHAKRFLLSELVHVIWIFDFGKYTDNIWRSKCHAKANGSTSPSLRKCLEHDKVGI